MFGTYTRRYSPVQAQECSIEPLFAILKNIEEYAQEYNKIIHYVLINWNSFGHIFYFVSIETLCISLQVYIS